MKPNLKIGICGEHGGEPESVKFCHQVGMSYVSCSPYRVPLAKLAAAQEAVADLAKKAAGPAPKRRQAGGQEAGGKASAAKKPAAKKPAKKAAPRRRGKKAAKKPARKR